MCALFGFLDFGRILPQKILRELTQALANSAEERGTDASGISYIKNGKVSIYKRPKPAHKLRFNFPAGTRAVMGHTRLTTQGNQKLNWNNHPFFGHADVDFAFAHNGVLYNDKELRQLKNLPDTHIETDSYVAVQLIEMQGELDFNGLKSMAEDVQGSFTFTALDQSNNLYFVKGSSPMYLIYFRQFGLYVYASTESIMKNALKSVGMQSFKYQVVDINYGDILRISNTGEITKSQFDTHTQYGFLDSNYYDWYDTYTEEEELLLEICSQFGVDENDVLTLLEYGYTTDEIEEMLMDTDMLNHTLRAIKEEEYLFKSCHE